MFYGIMRGMVGRVSVDISYIKVIYHLAKLLHYKNLVKIFLSTKTSLFLLETKRIYRNIIIKNNT